MKCSHDSVGAYSLCFQSHNELTSFPHLSFPPSVFPHVPPQNLLKWKVPVHCLAPLCRAHGNNGRKCSDDNGDRYLAEILHIQFNKLLLTLGTNNDTPSFLLNNGLHCSEGPSIPKLSSHYPQTVSAFFPPDTLLLIWIPNLSA